MNYVQNVEVRYVLSEPFEILVSWSPMADIEGYNIYTSESILSHTNLEKINSALITETNYKIETSQTPNRQFYFFVTGVDSYGRETPMDIYGSYIKYFNSFENNIGYSYTASKINEVYNETAKGSDSNYSTKFAFEETKLRVYIDGMRKKEDVDYAIDSNNEIILSLPSASAPVVDYWIKKMEDTNACQ